MHRPSPKRVARVLAILFVCAVGTLGALSGCEEKKPEGTSKEECGKIRKEAFDIINKQTHQCHEDKDCVDTKWPECRHAVNQDEHKKLTELQSKFEDGKCKDDGACKESPGVACKEGLCAMREAGEKRSF